MWTNKQLALLLREVAAVLEVKSENYFRINAYKTAADTLEHTQADIRSLAQSSELSNLPGIGKTIAGQLTEILSTGKSSEIEAILHQVPQGMFALLPLTGVGPKTAFKLASEFSLNNRKTAFNELKKKLKDNKPPKIPGIGEKTFSQLLSLIENYDEAEVDERIRIDVAETISQDIIAYLLTSSAVEQASALGSLRRRLPTVGDIDLGVSSDNPEAVEAHIQAFPKNSKIIASGKKLVRFLYHTGFNVDVKIVKPEEWGSLLQHFTGSKAHNIALREYALSKDMSLSEEGIKTQNTQKKFADEEQFYRFLGMEWIPPELRENRGEIEAALRHLQGKTPGLPNLVELSDIKGDFHTHTSYQWISSHDLGRSSVEDMILEAKSRGYTYISIGDHNPSTRQYSLEQQIKEVKKRTKVIHSYNRENDVKNRTPFVFSSLEVDIKPNGELALPDQALEHLDLALVSVHSSFDLSIDEMTDRVIQALKHPKVKILAHPTGKLYGKRVGYRLDWDRVFTICLEKKIAIEINANPMRLDVDETIVREGVKRGNIFVIDSDAHSVDGLESLKYGIDVARRGWASKEHIVNTWSLEKVKEWVSLH